MARTSKSAAIASLIVAVKNDEAAVKARASTKKVMHAAAVRAVKAGATRHECAVIMGISPTHVGGIEGMPPKSSKS